MKLYFFLRFYTKPGQSLWISGNISELGNNDPKAAAEMQYVNNEYWSLAIELKKKVELKDIRYKYHFISENGDTIAESPHDRILDIKKKDLKEIQIIDSWNHAGEYENVFLTAPFQQVLLNHPLPKIKANNDKHFTHVFRVKAPLLKKGQVPCLIGSGETLGEWSTENPYLLSKDGDWWQLQIELKNITALTYKYAVYCTVEKKLLQFEEGDNRFLLSEMNKHKVVLLHDGFVRLPNNIWKGAGVSIPVFSLRSKDSFGVGDFSDIKLLVDWAAETGLKLIQLLPVNDTIASNTWVDSYPYAGISAFALHPLYINLKKVAGKAHLKHLKPLSKIQEELNNLRAVDYELVMENKLKQLQELYELMVDECFANEDYISFFDNNKQWLLPYAAFCYYRDKYKTVKFNDWRTHKTYDKAAINKIFNSQTVASRQMKFYCFVQYHLHIQLKEAVDYAHKKGCIIKGDLPIGVHRNGCDVWMEPSLYNLNWQTGAPPDHFAVVGQNWEFPTYNWERMKQDNYTWWKQRFSQMSIYFDAFRIDHILGFFRIWSIPANAVQGILGRFVPCIPVHVNEFTDNGLLFDHDRFCKPFINDEIIEKTFGELGSLVKNDFLIANDNSGYDFKEEFATQKQIEKHFDEKEKTSETEKLKLSLFELMANVILLKEDDVKAEYFHFRISMEATSSYQYLIPFVQEKLKALYVDYFYRRQEVAWQIEGLSKLEKLKAATNMLICGEDLGMVPQCVPDVMRRLGILSLEIERMPKTEHSEFLDLKQLPYLSIVTPSTHDMSTLRGWWKQEFPDRIRRYFIHTLRQHADVPSDCEPWIVEAILKQHLFSPSMWCIFQLQEILGSSESLSSNDPADERINDPANPKNYWRYRMPVSLEELIEQKNFNNQLKSLISESGRD